MFFTGAEIAGNAVVKSRVLTADASRRCLILMLISLVMRNIYAVDDSSHAGNFHGDRLGHPFL